MTIYQISAISIPSHVKPADRAEWSLANHYQISRNAHDSQRFDKASDVETSTKNISVKTSHFTLMAGSLCNGLTDFDSIWNLYETTTHSNVFAYITADFTVYEMNIDEFKCFVYTFCNLEKESAKNGGALKIRCRKESGKMLKWLADKAAA